MMLKNSYLKEIVISADQRRNGTENTLKEVSKIQAWLNLFAAVNPMSGTATGIDGDFGPATEIAVKNFQKIAGEAQTGVVSKALFKKMCSPMIAAFTEPLQGSTLRQKIVEAAQHHVKAHARELRIKNKTNSGPWVRAYMDGNEGDSWLWCMGFVQTILDQSCSDMNMKFTDFVVKSFSCDTVAMSAKARGNFRSYSLVRQNPGLVEKGDLFLLQSRNNSSDWIHTGIITAVLDNSVFETIEGNTNDDGSSNGYAVVKRTRNFAKSKLDIVKLSLPT